MMKGHLLALGIGLIGSVASANPRATYRWLDPSRQGADYVAPAPSGVSHIIYLDNCQPSGCTLTPGSDGTQNQSDIINGQKHITAYSGSASQWQQIVSCVTQTYAQFDVQIVTTKPAAGTAYHHAIVAGYAADAGEQQGVLGVSPFSCGYIPNSISFSFADEEPTNIDDICWTVAQETAHSWGLDHKYDNRDPMTYLQTGPTMKTFQNMAGSCGEYSARACSCTYHGTNQSMNSVQLILDTFGSSAPDTTPPTVHITAPANGASVMAGFQVTADISDNQSVGKAELRIDGNLVGGALTGAPFQWNAPASLGQGAHHVEVTGYDTKGNMAKDAVDVTFGMTCSSSSPCMDANDVCVDGHCVPGPSMTGGLGSPCGTNYDCQSGQCASDGMNKYCVEPCDPSKNQCPGGFSCQATGSTGVCWPGGDQAGGGKTGGCNSGEGGGAILLGLGFAAVLITRKRK